MTEKEAMEVLAGPLRFDDQRQIDARVFIEQVDVCEKFVREDKPGAIEFWLYDIDDGLPVLNAAWVRVFGLRFEDWDGVDELEELAEDDERAVQE